VATPTNTILVTGVSYDTENKLVPEIVFSGTIATGTILSSLVASGLTSLQNGNILQAKAYFNAAVTNYPSDATNDGDTARFFYAVTRVAGINPYSDGNSADLNSVGDILDLMGCSPGGRSLPNPTMVCSKPLPLTTPTGSQMQAFLYNVIQPELVAALANLAGVSTSFTKTWTNPIDSKSYISDYGDVLVYKASLEGALAAINTQYAYNLGADIAGAVNNNTIMVQTFLSSNTSFLTLASSYSTPLATAKTYLSSAADDLSAAITKIQTRNTVAYLINLQSMTTAQLNNAKTNISAGKSSLATGYQLDFPETPGGMWTASDVIFMPSLFFGGINLKPLLPPFTGNTPGFFLDPTMGGIIVQGFNINYDGNHNGIPDILEE